MKLGIMLPPKEKNNGGINRVAYNILRNMEQMSMPHELVMLGEGYPDLSYPHIDLLPSYMQMNHLSFTLSAHPMDLVHTYYHPIDFSDKISCKRVMTIYDLYTIANPQWFSKTYIDFQDRIMRESAIKADLIIAISEATKGDIVHYYGIPEEKIKVVYLGVPELFQKQVESRDFPCPDRYLLSVSAIAQNKNQAGLVEAFLVYKERHPEDDVKLVLVGAMRQPEEIVALLEKAGSCREDVLYTGYVSDEELLQWYDRATACAYPSFYEGFGLPILEAMTRKKAVISSNTTSMPEVGGDAVCYCDPARIESITDAITKVLQDDGYRAELEKKAEIQAGKFSYARAARETLAIYDELLLG